MPTTPEQEQKSPKLRTSRISLDSSKSVGLPTQLPTPASRSKDKGKGKAIGPPTSSIKVASRQKPRSGSKEVKEASTGSVVRSTKRQRLKPELAAEKAAEESDKEATTEDHQLDFQMLDMPAIAGFPWVRAGLGSEDNMYVPPGVQSLIENMKNMLSAERTGRLRAEERHMEELNRRVALEKELEDQRMLHDLKITLSTMPLAEVEKVMNASGVRLDETGMPTLAGTGPATQHVEKPTGTSSTLPQAEAAQGSSITSSGITSETSVPISPKQRLPPADGRGEASSSSLVAPGSRPRSLARWTTQDSINRLFGHEKSHARTP
ncbi:hypothetical protein OF83DRAFT_944009 [Amylostereum chailletii]|nr:hypothetical protein OF83DRAFT_944009 [Amylostereum chailletii]